MSFTKQGFCAGLGDHIEHEQQICVVLCSMRINKSFEFSVALVVANCLYSSFTSNYLRRSCPSGADPLHFISASAFSRFISTCPRILPTSSSPISSLSQQTTHGLSISSS